MSGMETRSYLVFSVYQYFLLLFHTQGYNHHTCHHINEGRHSHHHIVIILVHCWNIFILATKVGCKGTHFKRYSFYLNYNHFSPTFSSVLHSWWHHTYIMMSHETETLMCKVFINPIDSTKLNKATYEKQSD